jgi:hypothetical protein
MCGWHRPPACAMLSTKDVGVCPTISIYLSSHDTSHDIPDTVPVSRYNHITLSATWYVPFLPLGTYLFCHLVRTFSATWYVPFLPLGTYLFCRLAAPTPITVA